MYYCSKCKVKIRTMDEKCPLCQSAITGEYVEEEQIFPKLPKVTSKYALVHQMITFTSILISVISIALNWILTPSYWWSAFVVGAVGCTWVVVNVGIVKRRNLMKNTLWQLFIIETIMILWDVFTGWEKWSLNYFIPLGILLALATMVCLTIFQKLTSPEYMIYILMVCLVGCVPLLLLGLHVVTVRVPSIICGGISLIGLSALIIFQRHAVVNEVSKKFHI